MKLLTEMMDNPNSKDALRELANLLQMQRDSAWGAIRQAIPCLDTDKDLSDRHVDDHCHPAIKARRHALRRCQSVLDSQNTMPAKPNKPGRKKTPEATKIVATSIGLSPGLPQLPPVPEGYEVNAWKYRGTNWNPGEFANYAYYKPGLSDGWVMSFGCKPIGSSGHYIEAVREPAEDQPPFPGAKSDSIEGLANLDHYVGKAFTKSFTVGCSEPAEVPACPECVQGYVQETGFDHCEKCNPEPASGVEARVCEDGEEHVARLRGLLLESVGMLVACMRDSRPPDQSKVEELCGRVNRQINKPAERRDHE